MKELTLPYRAFPEEMKDTLLPDHRIIREETDAAWITGNTVVMLENPRMPVLMRRQASIEEEIILDEIYDEALAIKFSPYGARRRGTGVTYACHTFGTTPKSHYRRKLSTGRSNFSIEHPQCDSLLEEIIARGWDNVRQHCPEMHLVMDSHLKALPEWRIRDTPFTTGVINETAAIPYHRDRGNIHNSGSVMWVTRKYVGGGHLHVPELGAIVDCSHGALVVFYGETFWHGVTRMKNMSRARAARYSIVAYTNSIVSKALDNESEEELAALRGTIMADDRRDTVLPQ